MLVLRETTLTQAEIADQVGVSQASVSEWRRGVSLPSAEKLAQLTMVLGVSGHWLLTGEGPVEPAGASPDIERVRSETESLMKLRFSEMLRLMVERLGTEDSLDALLRDVDDAMKATERDRRKRRGGQGRAG